MTNELDYYLNRLINTCVLLGAYSERTKINKDSEYDKAKRKEYYAKKERILYKIKQLYARNAV